LKSGRQLKNNSYIGYLEIEQEQGWIERLIMGRRDGGETAGTGIRETVGLGSG
jgi:hypothetical protein